MDALRNFPFFVFLLGLAILSMLPIAVVSLQVGEFAIARAFFYAALLLSLPAIMLAIALRGYRPVNTARSHLITLVAAYPALPILFVLPFQNAVPDTTLLNAYFEMVSAFTTTGASAIEPARLAPVLHLWRAEVGWLGGLFVWITVAAVMGPLNLGGYEVTSNAEPGRGVGGTSILLPDLETPGHLVRAARVLFPIYAGLTLVLWISMILTGAPALEGIVLSMSVMATSGIGTSAAENGLDHSFATEFLLLLFMVFALSRRSFSGDNVVRASGRLADDAELRTGVLLVGGTTALLFLRHFVGAVEVGAETETAAAISAFWGTLFTVMSFISTTGFVSANWIDAQAWSGLQTPGFALAGLVIIGGGIATTAGGVKLLRVYSLYFHGRSELQRLVHPSAVVGIRQSRRSVSARGVYIAWLFFMLYALSIALVWVALAATGIAFDDAMLLTISVLSNCGPLAPVVSDGALHFGDLAAIPKWILMVAMVLGRVEMLAMIAMINTEFWRG